VLQQPPVVGFAVRRHYWHVHFVDNGKSLFSPLQLSSEFIIDSQISDLRSQVSGSYPANEVAT